MARKHSVVDLRRGALASRRTVQPAGRSDTSRRVVASRMPLRFSKKPPGARIHSPDNKLVLFLDL
jgi:hypothetical protein